MAGQQGEQERLFDYGYASGKQFVQAVRAGKVSREDLANGAPIGVLLLLGGPTDDFILGRIYAAAEDDAEKDAFKSAKSAADEEARAMLANNELRRRNCHLIGHDRRP